MVVLKSSVYNSILKDISEYHGLSQLCKKILEDKYPNISPFTLGSILATQLQWQMKRNYKKSQSLNKKYLNDYNKCKENGEAPGILLRLSTQFHLTPSLLARSILQTVYNNRDSPHVSSLIKDTTLIEDRQLAHEVYLCNLFDNEYGLFGNAIRQGIGEEYEKRLEVELRALDITFIDEHVLRKKGYDKTPDFKLIIPIAVDGFVINWIESKALFGDDVTHAGYLKDQLLCYWNRFGPGLVIYWFGYLDELEKTPENNKMMILKDHFPKKDSITFMNPSILDT